MKSLKILLIVVLISISFNVFAQENGRTITVTGEAEMWVKPDMVTFYFGVETEDSKLDLAKRHNDDLISTVLMIVEKIGIPAEDIHTDYLSIKPITQKHNITTYVVTRKVTITLRDLTKLDELLNNALAAGINTIYGVEFSSSEYEKYKTEVLIQAINQAQDKAKIMAEQLNQIIGKPLQIFDEYNTNSSGLGNKNFSMNSKTLNTLTISNIEISSAVTIVFELLERE